LLLGLDSFNGCRTFFNENAVAAIETANTGIFVIDVNLSFAVGTVVRQMSHLYNLQLIQKSNNSMKYNN